MTSIWGECPSTGSGRYSLTQSIDTGYRDELVA
jgi:hypothetical protein